ncbi:chemotaxis protein CheD [Faecalicatena sp. AGMB00832]|uniref:Probable chemoreceptor glutamine deamidase CheD n=1 Tax=Faecalicatena faecalis TaxID=2726362 RepID=A0ABS6CYB7_9FIRM|nr:chemotaxis protein CheD [Faecalicatena faecalis]MBU3874259.1 chemotaxis protein CheD [Faecalicatena faecalis]
MEKIVVGIAEGKTAACGQALVSYALGSCVGVCLYDAKHKVAAMAHVILPDKHQSLHQENEYKFAVEGTHRLVQEICRKGAEKKHLTAKIAGGAKMFSTAEQNWNIGYWNVKNVKRALEEEGIRLVGEDTGGSHGRTITFLSENGTLEVRTVRQSVIYI